MTYSNISRGLVSSILRTTLPAFLIACLALSSMHQRAEAAMVNFSSIEVGLSDPNDKMGMMNALWTGWQTQVYEYNMPFIEVANEVTDTLNITEFRFSIGDTNYGFSNEFMHKAKTNSYDIPATGEYALLGKSTPTIPITSALEDGGDTLVVYFGNGGLAPGQTARFQVDINADNLNPGMMYFAPYTEVFFNNGDTTDNSLVSLTFDGTDQIASAYIPDYDVPHAVSLTTPRQHSEMQMIDPLPGLELNGQVPEPGSLALLAIAGLGATLGRGRRQSRKVA